MLHRLGSRSPLLDDIWYIYHTAGETTDLDGQNLHVLVGKAKRILGQSTHADSPEDGAIP
jgi:hypothetical protein